MISETGFGDGILLQLALSWTGPYLVVQKLGPLTYGIQKTENARIINVHVDHLKLYVGNAAPDNWIDVTQISEM